MSQQKRLMFIAWNWKKIEKTLNEIVLWNENPMGIDEWRNIAFDEFDLAVHKPSGTEVPDATGSKVIRIRIKDGEGIGMIPHILKIIGAYGGADQKVFLFLHRSDGFSSKDVQVALKDKLVNKCFLFSNGRDFIYFNTQSIGLLSNKKRGFHYQAPENGKLEIIVASEKKKIVYQPYFDKVWDYYEHEFHTKITEIRTDLLYHLWSHSFPDDQVWKPAQYQALIRRQEMLYLRIKNLLDKEYDLTEPERKKLIAWEKKQQKSFVFDDCRENMERVAAGVKKKYSRLHDRLVYLFFAEIPNATSRQPIRDNLRDLCNDFDNLLSAIEAC